MGLQQKTASLEWSIRDSNSRPYGCEPYALAHSAVCYPQNERYFGGSKPNVRGLLERRENSGFPYVLKTYYLKLRLACIIYFKK